MTHGRCVARLAAILAAIGCGAGCTQRIPEPIGGPPGSPRIGWVIMSGDAENPDREYVCQSIAQVACVVPASSPASRVFGNAHFYYHPASVETKYTGSIRVGFFDGDPTGNLIRPNVTVKPGESPGNQSVSDIVTSKPGTYTVTIDIVATASATGQTQNLRAEVPVVVR